MTQPCVLLIPDGIRRFSRETRTELTQCYFDASSQLFSYAASLLQDCDHVGVFPLAAYNLDRDRVEVSALLKGGARGMLEALPRFQRKPIVIGQLSSLLAIESTFATILDGCLANPYDRGSCPTLSNRLVVFLNYDWRDHFRVLFKHWPDGDFPSYPSWTNVVRTGCENGAMRLSASFIGLEQALFHPIRSLFPRVTLEEIRAAVRNPRPW